MIACLKYGYRCFGNASGLVLTCLLCCYAPGYRALLVASITFILVMLDSSTCWVGHVLRCMTNIGYRVPLICIVPCCQLVKCLLGYVIDVFLHGTYC